MYWHAGITNSHTSIVYYIPQAYCMYNTITQTIFYHSIVSAAGNTKLNTNKSKKVLYLRISDGIKNTVKELLNLLKEKCRRMVR